MRTVIVRNSWNRADHGETGMAIVSCTAVVLAVLLAVAIIAGLVWAIWPA